MSANCEPPTYQEFLAELDYSVISLRERIKFLELTKNEAEAERVREGLIALTAFRSYIRSLDFLKTLELRRGRTTT